MDGSKCVRVISNIMEISNDKEKVEANANYAMLGLNAIK